MIALHRLSRRRFLSRLSSLGVAAAASSLRLGSTFAQEAREMPTNITSMTASQLSAAIRTRQVSCVEVMQAYLQRIHRFNPVYNAIVSMRDDEVLIAEARRADEELGRG